MAFDTPGTRSMTGEVEAVGFGAVSGGLGDGQIAMAGKTAIASARCR
jgi:hypothetical protein